MQALDYTALNRLLAYITRPLRNKHLLQCRL